MVASEFNLSLRYVSEFSLVTATCVNLQPGGLNAPKLCIRRELDATSKSHAQVNSRTLFAHHPPGPGRSAPTTSRQGIDPPENYFPNSHMVMSMTQNFYMKGEVNRMTNEETANNDEVMTAAETSELLRVPIDTLYRLAREGKVPALRIGRGLRFSRSTLLEMLRQRPGASATSRN